MKVLKFGGTSLASSNNILNVLQIISDKSRKGKTGLVLSAVAGVTNLLVESVIQAQKGENICNLIAEFREIHEKIILSLNKSLKISKSTNFTKAKTDLFLDKTMKYLSEICAKYETLFQGIQLIKECPDKVYCHILSFGERLSTKIFYELLLAHKLDVILLDSCDFIKTKGSLKEGIPILDEIEKRFEMIRNKSNKIILMAGFIGSDLNGNLSLLGRNGSDYSSSLMALGLKAKYCEIWTDVNGIYTADPSFILNAKLIEEMSYGEAMELACYGAKVLHPKTTLALSQCNIPLYIKNTLNPQACGTKVSSCPVHDNHLIRGIASIDDIALIRIHGSGIKNLPGISARIFTTLANCDVEIMLLLSQASSENAICFCITGNNIDFVQHTLQNELFLEIQSQVIEAIEIIHNQSILCVVEDQIPSKHEIAGKFFAAIAKNQIKMLAIAYGSSERSISVVIDSKESKKAMEAIHNEFFIS